MTQADLWIQRCLARLRTGQRLEVLADFLSVYLLTFGALVLIVKLMLPAYWPEVLWLALLAVPGAWLACQRQRHLASRSDSIAWLDGRLKCQGLLLTLAECPDAAWETHLPQFEKHWHDAVPRLAPTRFGRLVTIPFLFLLVACLIPSRPAVVAATTTSTSTSLRVAEELEGVMKSLEDTAALTKKDQEEVKQEIERFRQEAKKGPLTHERWETVDALRARIKLKLDEATREVRGAREIAARLASEAERTGVELTEAEREELEDLLFETLQKMKEQGALDQIENKDLQEQLQQLARRETSSEEGDANEPGSKTAGQRDPNQKPSDPTQRLSKKKNELKKNLSKNTKERRKQLESLRDFLEEQEQKLAECRGQCQGGNCQGGLGNTPGVGGVSEGRGDAELTFGDESTLDGTKFKEVILPEGAKDDPKNETVGVSSVAPSDVPADSAPRNALRQHDAATGDESWSRTLSPRHRSVVRKYFDDKKSPK